MDEGQIRVHAVRARAGDSRAFGDLFRALEPEVARLCQRLLGSKEEARDATSETFLRARGALDAYDPRQPFRRWLFTIGARHCIDRLRRRRTEARLFEPAELDEGRVPSRESSPLRGMLRAEARGRVLQAIVALPDRYRAPIVLRYYGDFDYDAIGEILGVSRSQVGTLLFRARRRLRDALSGTDEREATR